MWTVILNLVVMFFTLLLTIPIGILTAVKRGSVFDNSMLVLTVVGISLPLFLFAMLLIIIFAVLIPILPLQGMHAALLVPGEVSILTMFFNRARHMVLPVTAMTLSSLGVMTRYVRATMCDALTEDYVRTARAKGLREKVVIYSHAFRNVMIPLVTSITGMFMTLFSGSVIIERIFGWSGMGQTMLESIMRQDYAITMSVQMFYVLVAIMALLLMDLVYGLVDPRIRVVK
jgi:peptide/nickel transport system permease protein